MLSLTDDLSIPGKKIPPFFDPIGNMVENRPKPPSKSEEAIRKAGILLCRSLNFLHPKCCPKKARKQVFISVSGHLSASANAFAGRKSGAMP